MYSDTIAAISTAPADGAISIIRLSGPEAIKLADSVFDRDLKSKPSHTITYGIIEDNGHPIDEVLISLFRAPRSYTTEDVVEINAHGGLFVTQKILSLLLEKGARLARPGEFTERALINGRITYAQAEAVQDMIEAENDYAASQAIYALKGGIQKLLDPLIDRLTEIIAQIEVNIDYPEYDIEQLTYQELLPQADQIIEEMKEMIRKAEQSLLFKKGIDTVIIGKPNVGKSSLLNALLLEEKAIVTEIAGTTRDLVEGKIKVGPWQLNLIDTAGIHEATDRIEKIGIEKSKERLDQANLVLLVLDGSRPLEKEDQELLELTANKQRVILINKEDILQESFLSHPLLDDYILISAKENNIDALYKKLEKLFGKAGNQMFSLSNTRQIGLLKNALTDMMNAREAMELQEEADLIEIDLVSALDHLKEIVGKASREDLLDTLFSKFCLGK